MYSVNDAVDGFPKGFVGRAEGVASDRKASLD